MKTSEAKFETQVEFLPAVTSVQAGIPIAKLIGIGWFYSPMLCIGKNKYSDDTP